MTVVTREQGQAWMADAIASAVAKHEASIRRQEAIRSRLKALNRQADQFARNLSDINRERDALMAEQVRLMRRELAA